MKLSDLTLMVLELNAALDLGRHDKITIEEAVRHIEAGDVFDWLPQATDAQFDFSLQRDRGALGEILEGWRSLANAVDAKRKFGVDYSGLCLMLAYTNEMIQQRTWTD